jgi:hypothetical protein
MIWRWPSQNRFGMRTVLCWTMRTVLCWTMRTVLYWIMRTVLHWTRSLRTQFGVSINVWRLAGDILNITCNILYFNHQVHRDFLITLYHRPYTNSKISYQYGCDFQTLQSFETLKCEWTSRGNHETTHTLMKYTVMFYWHSVTILVFTTCHESGQLRGRSTVLPALALLLEWTGVLWQWQWSLWPVHGQKHLVKSVRTHRSTTLLCQVSAVLCIRHVSCWMLSVTWNKSVTASEG